MLTLGVTTRAETADRMADPLRDRGIDVRFLPATGRAFPLTDAQGSFDGAQRPAGTDGAGEVRHDRNDRHEDGDGVRATDEGVAAVAEERVDVGFVYPSRFTEGGVVDALYDLPWVNDRTAIATSRNKAAVLATLARAGLPVPESVLVSDPTDEGTLENVFERFDPPVVVKPTSATRGIGVTKVGELDSFLGVCDYLGLIHDFPATEDKSFLVQEFIDDARDFRVMVIDGEYAGAVERRGAGWKHNVHRGAEAVGVPVSDDLAALAEAVSQVLDVPYLGVDLLVTDERTVVTETNARPTIDDAAKYRENFYDALAALIHATER